MEAQAANLPKESRLIGQLVRNNPRGACRCPPEEELATLKRLSERIGLRRRLCSCRQPDFLLELILSQRMFIYKGKCNLNLLCIVPLFWF